MWLRVMKSWGTDVYLKVKGGRGAQLHVFINSALDTRKKSGHLLVEFTSYISTHHEHTSYCLKSSRYTIQ